MEKKEPLSKHRINIETVTNVVKVATALGIVHRTDTSEEFDSRYVEDNGQKLLFFGSCGYLALEKHPALIDAAMQALQKHGTQFSSSRAYISSQYYDEAESLLSKMFENRKVILFQSLTLGHISTLPLLVDDNDAVIVDERAHDSIQSAVHMLKLRQIKIEVLRHNKMTLLEDRIKILSNRYKKIWYLADGMYSMHGDFAPIKRMYELADKYEQFYMYVDDIHGMSWTGKHGTGITLDAVPDLHRKLFLCTGLTKAFGTMGGVHIFPDEESYRLVKSCGKGFIFSIQMPPYAVASTIASCKIHLSDEIYPLQEQLKFKIDHFSKRCDELGLLVLHKERSPVFFIGVGKPPTGYDMVLRMKKAGFFFNISVYPAVSLFNTGLRITLNNKLTLEDIDNLLFALAENLPEAFKENETTLDEVKKAFGVL